MPKSTEERFKGDIVTVTEGGLVIHIGQSLDKPSKRLYPQLVDSLKRRVRHEYKNLVWSPTTEPNPRKYKWSKKGGGYQGLNSTEI